MPRSSSRRSLLIVLLLLLAIGGTADSQTRRALLVGINTYRPEGAAGDEKAVPPQTTMETKASRIVSPKGRGAWTNLDGCLNDVEAMREVLVARYGFAPANVTILKDSGATRGAIFSTIRKKFIAEASPGDELLFFYAGHGSQVVNSKSSEPDRKDETIVPSDSYFGVPDIRDKEIKKVFNEVIDKGGILTLIFDCCHSGSIARGLPLAEKTRFLEPDPRDVADPSSPETPPEERGALVFSAAQDIQLAAEAIDDNGLPHGAFTLALLRTLVSAPVNEPAEHIAFRVKAILQSEGRTQEPVFAGSAERLRKPLLGAGLASLSGHTRVAVLRVADDGEIELQGGLALGLSEGCELRKAGAPGAQPRVRVRVRNVSGLARSGAAVIEGKPQSIQPGDLLEVDRWTGGSGISLRVWVPANPPSQSWLGRFAESIATIMAKEGVQWIDDPTVVTPTHVLQWGGSGWRLILPGGKSEEVGRSPGGGMLVRRLKASPGEIRFYLNLPPGAELAEELLKGVGSPTSTIVVTPSQREAHYLLVGRLLRKEVEYAWALPHVTREDSASLTLPVRTDWISGLSISGKKGGGAGKLGEMARRLARVRGWLRIDPPPDEGRFPYRLALKNSKTNEVKTTGPVVEGEAFGLVLRADKEVEEPPVKRYVYVFAIDSYGNSTLLFPGEAAGNVENRIPYETEGKPPIEIQLGRKVLFTVGPPFGTDTYILVTSEQALPDPDALSFQGVRTRGERAAGETPLALLLNDVGSVTRGSRRVTPADWSLERLSIRSVPQQR